VVPPTSKPILHSASDQHTSGLPVEKSCERAKNFRATCKNHCSRYARRLPPAGRERPARAPSGTDSSGQRLVEPISRRRGDGDNGASGHDKLPEQGKTRSGTLPLQLSAVSREGGAISGSDIRSKACPAAAYGSKMPRSRWLPWPVNASVSLQYTECSQHDNISRAQTAGRRGQSRRRRSGRARLHGRTQHCQPPAGVAVREATLANAPLRKLSQRDINAEVMPGWRNIRSTGWTSSIANRRHLCGAHSAKASPCLAGGTTRAYKTGQPPTASTSSSRIYAASVRTRGCTHRVIRPRNV
jgi:hypothetical protein